MSRQRRAAPSRPAIDAALPEIAPVVPGKGPLPAEMGDKLRASMRLGMGNFVAQQLMRDAMTASPEADAASTLAAEQGEESPAGEGEKAQVEAASALAAAPGGAPLPGAVAERLGASLGADLSGVRVHADEAAVEELDAGAAAFGQHLYFAPGAYDPNSEEGLGLIAHEAVHAVESGGAAPAAPKSIGATDASAEQRAEAVQAAVVNGEEAPVSVTPGRASSAVMRRGEAGVHHEDLTMPALGVDNPDVAPQGEERGHAELTEGEERALQVYSGNYIADNSQALSPVMVGITEKALLVTLAPKADRIEAAGVLIQAVIQAMAVLAIGTDAASLVVPENIEVYEAERHIDNPQGSSQGDYVVKNKEGDLVGEATSPAGGLDTTALPGGSAPTTRDADTLRHHGGSAVPGLQYENPKLYEASDAGLSNHLYNSIEASKNSYTTAARLAESPETRPEARMHVGYGDHIVQDYFSHSNFIEIALNRYINDAIAEREQTGEISNQSGELVDQLESTGPVADAGQGGRAEDEWVATLYDKRVGEGEDQRSVVTTGTFGSDDNTISLTHAMLPAMPALHSALMTGADQAGEELRAMEEESSWSELMARMQARGPEGEAFAILNQAMGDVGVCVMAIVFEGPAFTETPIQLSEDGPSLGSVQVPDMPNIATPTLPLPEAILAYANSVRNFKAWQQALLPYADEALIAALLLAAAQNFEQMVCAFFQALKMALEAVVKAILIAIIVALSAGANPIELARMTGMSVEELMLTAGEKLESAEAGTDLNDRMNDTDWILDDELGDMSRDADEDDPAATQAAREELERRVGPVVGSGTNKDPWRLAEPAPPSHSQVGKDHPTHPVTDPEGPHAGPEIDASAFYELHVELAREAGRHIYKELDAVFAEASQGEEAYLIDAEASARRDSEMVEDHDATVAVAEARGDEEAERAAEQGFEHAQSSESQSGDPYERTPSLMKVHDLVDLFIAHPDDDRWWVALVDAFVGANPKAVYNDILRRNEDAA